MTTKQNTRHTLSIICLFLLVCAFVQSGERPDAFVVLPDAEDIQYSSVGSTVQLRYGLRARYPAIETLARLNDSLVDRGWALMSRSFLDPSVMSSFVTGWVEYEDKTEHIPILVHQWSAPWVNARGEVVQYTLHYSSPTASLGVPPDPGDWLEELTVIAIFFDKNAADDQREYCSSIKSGDADRGEVYGGASLP